MAESRVAARLRWIDACRARYQNCGSLEVPAEALESWTEHELTMFFESMGMIKPQTAAEKALADAQWREKLITEKEERLWRSAEAEGVALVVREIDREAEKRAHKALARARAWTAVELAARPRRWRRAGVRSRSKSPDPARRITKRDVDRARSRTRGRARLEDSDSDSSSSSEEEWRPRGIQPRAVRLMLAAEAAPAVHFRSRRRKLGVFDLARRAACRAVLARPPADGHFYAPMDGIVDTAAAVAEETAWLAFGTAARATMAAARRMRGHDARRPDAAGALDAPAAAPSTSTAARCWRSSGARRKEPPPPPPVAAAAGASPSPRAPPRRPRRRRQAASQVAGPQVAEPERRVARLRARPPGRRREGPRTASSGAGCGVPRAAVGAVKVAGEAVRRRVTLAANLGFRPARHALRRGGWLPVCVMASCESDRYERRKRRSASPRRDGDGYDSGESVGSEASLLGAVRCPEWDDPWELNAGPPKTWLARLPRQGLGVLARFLGGGALAALGAACRCLGASSATTRWRLAAGTAASRPPPYVAGFRDLDGARTAEVYGWGANGRGQLGLGDSRTRKAPNDALRGRAVVCVAALGDRSACGCADGSVYAWGATVGEAFRDRPAKLAPLEPEAEAAFDEGPWLDDDADHGEAPSTAAARPPAGPPTRVALSPRRDCVEVCAEYADGCRRLFGFAAKRTPAFDGGAGALGLRAALATVDVVSAAATAAAVNVVAARDGTCFAWRAKAGDAPAAAAPPDCWQDHAHPDRAARDAVRRARRTADGALKLESDAPTVRSRRCRRPRAAALLAAHRAEKAHGLGGPDLRRMQRSVAALAAARAVLVARRRRRRRGALDGPDDRLRRLAAAASRSAAPRLERVALPVAVSQVAAGASFVVALAVDGSVFAFGDERRRRRRPEATPKKARAAAVASGAPRKVDAVRDALWVGAGRTFAAALDDDGVLHVWGSGAVLGRDAPVKAPMPVWPLASRRVVAAAATTARCARRAARAGRAARRPTPGSSGARRSAARPPRAAAPRRRGRRARAGARAGRGAGGGGRGRGVMVPCATLSATVRGQRHLAAPRWEQPVMGRASKYRVNKVAVAPPPEVTPVASRAPTLASAPSVGPVSSPQVLRTVDGELLQCGSDPFGKSSAGALSRPAPGAATGPPTDRPWVLIRSADERRRPELTALAERAGFGSAFHRTAQGALDELAAIQHPRSGRSLPLACLVDAYDEDGDGVIDQGEMSWPLLRVIQRPHAPFEASLKRIFVIVYSRPVAASPRYTLDALGAGARMVTGVAGDATRALERRVLFAHYSLFHVAERGADAKCPLCAKVTRRTKGFESFATHLEEYHTPEGTDQDGDAFISSHELKCMVLSNPKVHRGLAPPTVADFAAAAPEKTFDAYALLVVRRPADGKFLLARPGETMVEAAVASCLRDTNVKVSPRGLLRILMEPSEKKTPKPIKTVPSFHSVGAIWVGLEDLLDIHGNEYRSEDPKVFFPQIASGALQPEAFGSTWAALEALCVELGGTHPDELQRKRDATLPEQWVNVERRYPNIAFKEHDVLARSSRR
ncbi:ubiquitin-protein transferase [Aureococcus anophagefferens]|nr:ubiquitin-protein transferase [Aureococcus anophagefferens]